MPETTLGRRLDRALLALRLAPQGAAVDYGRIVVSTQPTKTKEPPAADLSAEEWAARAEELITGLERMLDGEPWGPRRSLGALKNAVRPLAGHASGYVAYTLGESVSRVVQARTALGVNPETGLPKPRPLTSREVPA